jgi:pimeloyl-ACP methyl ester carboxylesterase
LREKTASSSHFSITWIRTSRSGKRRAALATGFDLQDPRRRFTIVTGERQPINFFAWVQQLRLQAVAAVVATLAFGIPLISAEEPVMSTSDRPANNSPEGPDAADSGDREAGLFNLQLPTIGGKQFWTDHRWQDGWRIQQNAFTGHWRLLDPGNVRHAWGSREACEQILKKLPVADISTDLDHIVLVHGLFRSASSMQPLSTFLKDRRTRRIVVFEYASTRESITEHAAALREVVEGLPQAGSISFVGHSMGNIVVRHALGDWERDTNQQLLDRVKAVVMLGPPNQGAAIARQLAKLPAYGLIAGKGGLELGPQWEQLQAKLAIPRCPFGIIAGRLPDGFQNPLVGDAGDFVVSVDETRLPGGAFLEVNQVHSLLMDDTTVQQAVGNFIDHQRFD